jgi:hypothetical protein
MTTEFWLKICKKSLFGSLSSNFESFPAYEYVQRVTKNV